MEAPLTLSVRNAARERLAAGELSLGIGLRQARSVEIAKLMKAAGFDWLFIDLEHNVMSIETASEISVAALNAATLVVVMLETPRAIENADAIAAVPGIDVLLIGTNDLALEMGIPGEVGHERIVDAYRRVIDACHRHGKWPGMG